MFQFLKRYKQLLTGIIIGSMVTTVGVATAANTSVSALVMNTIKFNFNGADVPLPETYKVLNYNNTNYVPARFVAESLGATVDFANNTILIQLDNSGTQPWEQWPDEQGSNGNQTPPTGNTTPTTPATGGTTTPPTPSTGGTTTPVPVTDPIAEEGRNFGKYKEVVTQPISEVTNKSITIPATYKLETNSYATRVAGQIYNTGSSTRDVIIRAEFYDANNKLIAKGIGVVNGLAAGTAKTFLCYADIKLSGVHHYYLMIE